MPIITETSQLVTARGKLDERIKCGICTPETGFLVSGCSATILWPSSARSTALPATRSGSVLLFAKVGSGAATQKEGAGAKFDIGDAGIEQFRNDRSAAIVGICDNRDCGGQVQDIERFLLTCTQVEIIAIGVRPAVTGAGETDHALERSSVAAGQKLVISAVDRIKEAGEFILRESWTVPFEPTPNGRALMWINSAVIEAVHHHATALQEKAGNMNKKPALENRVSAERVDAHGSIANCKSTQIALDTDLAGRADAFNPAELLLAAIAACMLKGIEPTMPMLKFQLSSVAVRLTGRRQDAPPKMIGIDYELWVDTDEPDRRLQLLHHNVRKFGTIFNTVSAACPIDGTIHRGIAPWRLSGASRDETA